MPFAGTMGSASVFVASEKPVHQFTGLATQGASPYTSWSATTMQAGPIRPVNVGIVTRSVAVNMTVSGTPATISYSFACQSAGQGYEWASVNAYFYTGLNLTGTQTLIATLYADPASWRNVLSSGGSVSVPVGTKSCYLIISTQTSSSNTYAYGALTLS